jgi:sulfide:quinone oxidoreductase
VTDPKTLTDEIAVCAFVPPEELAELAPRFRTIVNNRPDREEPGQPTSAELEAEARRLGLDYVHIPVVPGQVKADQVAAFGDAVTKRKGPVLAFCKSGRRAATLWALSQAGQRSAEEILRAAAAAGYDLSALRPELEERAARA